MRPGTSAGSGPISSCSASSFCSCCCGRPGSSERGRSRRSDAMASGPDLPNVPDRPDAVDRPRIGVDEWVAQAEERRELGRGPGALVSRGWGATPPPIKLLLFVAFAGTLPLYLNEGDLLAYGLYTLLYAVLALGVNIVVGFAGLLDLGYVAFYGVGAYSYALLSSNHYGIHWQAEASIPVVVAATALVGLALGLTSRRLLGDYLAIVTLFFGQAFVAFTNNANPKVAGKGLTGGSNGIPGVDPINLFGYQLHSTKQYLYLLLIVFALARTGLAGAARGPARGGDDEHAVEPAEAHGVCLRRGNGRAQRSNLRRDPDGHGPRQLRHLVADHDLRDRHPRRAGEHRRRGRRREIGRAHV